MKTTFLLFFLVVGILIIIYRKPIVKLQSYNIIKLPKIVIEILVVLSGIMAITFSILTLLGFEILRSN